NKQKSFNFEYTSQMGSKFDGIFEVKCHLNIGEKHALEMEKTRLLGPYTNPTDTLVGIAVILSDLRHKLVSGPNWWTQSYGGQTIEEEDVLTELHKKVQETEDEWRKELAEKAKKPEVPAQEDK